MHTRQIVSALLLVAAAAIRAAAADPAIGRRRNARRTLFLANFGPTSATAWT
jgi:hypothetical protein